MIEIPSPSQTYDGANLIPASEWKSSTLLIPKSADWRVRMTISATLYGDAYLEVVTLVRRLFYNGAAKATYYLWTTPDGKACPIENRCDPCSGRGGKFDSELTFVTCLDCDGRGWRYAD